MVSLFPSFGALIDQSQNIAKYKSMLQEEADKIQKINSKLQVLESQISQQKNAQRQVLVRLTNERQIYLDTNSQNAAMYSYQFAGLLCCL